MDRDYLKARIQDTIDLLVEQYFDDFPLDVVCMASAKTEAHYLRVLSRAIRDLYAGDISPDDMLQTMVELLDQQMRRAFREGMRQNGLDPDADMTDEWEEELQAIIDGEFEYVARLIDDVVAAREAQSGTDGLLARAELWAGRYNDVVNQAKLITAAKGAKFEWVYGDTEHCDTCAALNGLVAYATEWEEAGFHPQQPPNELLTCGGWRCQCVLQPTDKRRSPGVLGTLADLATARNV